MSRCLNAGIIGLGVGEKHISGYNNHPNCKVTKICDFNKDKLNEVHSRHQECIAIENANEILIDPNAPADILSRVEKYLQIIK